MLPWLCLGYRIGRVRVIFSIPQQHVHGLFANAKPPAQLAYIEWFTPFTQPDPNHGLYKISKAMKNGLRHTSIIPLDHIRRTIQLFPSFGATVPEDWTSENVLDECTKFFVNSFTDRHTYGTVF